MAIFDYFIIRKNPRLSQGDKTQYVQILFYLLDILEINTQGQAKILIFEFNRSMMNCKPEQCM